jgi:hypothetical protein
MNETNFIDVDVQDLTFVEVENLVDDTQLSAEAVCACGTSGQMGVVVLLSIGTDD